MKVTDDLAARVLCLPFFETMSLVDMQHVAATLQAGIDGMTRPGRGQRGIAAAGPGGRLVAFPGRSVA